MAKLSLFNLWFCCSEGCEYLEEIDLGLSSSGLREDNEDPVEEPLACRDNPDIDKGFLLSFIFILSISRFKDVFLEAWGLCSIVKITMKERDYTKSITYSVVRIHLTGVERLERCEEGERRELTDDSTGVTVMVQSQSVSVHTPPPPTPPPTADCCSRYHTTSIWQKLITDSRYLWSHNANQTTMIVTLSIFLSRRATII